MKNRVILILAFLVLIPFYTLYAGDKALSLKTSTPENGTTGVALDASLELEFSNNVVNMKVAENNKECFTLVDNTGLPAAITVIIPDDQIEPEKKRLIILSPVSLLHPGTTYTIVVSPALIAKNGNALEEETLITFTTVE